VRLPQDCPSIMTTSAFIVMQDHPNREDPTMKHTDPTHPETIDEQLLAEDLIEEVSIDGMCGVY
jgi:mycofactocin precursor